MRAFGVLLFSCALTCAQTQEIVPDTTVIRSRAIDASGGAKALAALADYTASGTIVYFEGEKEDAGIVSIKFRSKGALLRFDAGVQGGDRSWVLNGTLGEAKQGDKVSVLSPGVALSLRHYALPVWALAQSPVIDAKVIEADPTEPFQRLEVAPSSKMDPRVLPSRYGVDDVTGHIKRVVTEVHSRPGVATIKQEFSYGNFRVVNGILFPFLIEEWNAGQLISRIQLEQLKTNTGLSYSEFKLESPSFRKKEGTK